MKPIIVGNIFSRTPVALAEYVIETVSDLGLCGTASFTLTCGSDRKLRIHRWKRDKKLDPAEFVANFTKRMNPDDLAADIHAAREGQ